MTGFYPVSTPNILKKGILGHRWKNAFPLIGFSVSLEAGFVQLKRLRLYKLRVGLGFWMGADVPLSCASPGDNPRDYTSYLQFGNLKNSNSCLIMNLVKV